MGKVWIVWGCIFGFSGVALGAFGAHALKELVSAEKMTVLETANTYLFYHAFALLALGLWNHWEKWSRTLVTGLCFVLGVFIFSGSLYIYVLLDLRTAALFTPVGGGLFLLGWTLFALTILRTKNTIV